MYNIPDHPVIRRMERTGYPWQDDSFIGYCIRCGKPIYEGDHYGQTWLSQSVCCEDCLMGDDEPMWEEDE